MKKFINSLGLILLAAAAGYSAYWYVLANKAETAFKESIAQWQKENNVETFSYDSLSKEGFPSHINLRLENVKVKKTEPENKANYEANFGGSVTLSERLITTNVKVKKTEPENKAIYEANFGGSVTLSIPLWQKERLITTHGTTTLQSTYGAQTDTPHTVVAKGKTSLALEDGNSTHFDILKNIFLHGTSTDPEKQLSFISFKSNLDELSIKADINEKTPLQITTGPLDIKVQKKDYKAGQQEIVYSMYTKDFQVNTPDSTEVLSVFYYNPSEMGKTKIALDGSVCYPEQNTWEELGTDPFKPRKAEACFKVDKFTLTSDLFDSNLQNFVLSLVQDNSLWTATLKGTSDGTYTEKYDQSIRKSLGILLKDPKFTERFVGSDPKDQHQLTQASDDIVKLIPSLHEFGKVTNKIDFIGSADIQNNVAETAKYDLSALEYVLPPYAVSITSKGDFKKNFSDPNINGILKITRYKQLVENLLAFYNRVVQVYNKHTLAENTNIAGLSPEAIKKTLTFLKEISDDPAKETSDLRVTFVYNEKDQWKIGTLKLQDFLGKAFDLYGTLAPQPPVVPPEALPAPEATPPVAPAKVAPAAPAVAPAAP